MEKRFGGMVHVSLLPMRRAQKSSRCDEPGSHLNSLRERGGRELKRLQHALM